MHFLPLECDHLPHRRDVESIENKAQQNAEDGADCD